RAALDQFLSGRLIDFEEFVSGRALKACNRLRNTRIVEPRPTVPEINAAQRILKVLLEEYFTKARTKGLRRSINIASQMSPAHADELLDQRPFNQDILRPVAH